MTTKDNILAIILKCSIDDIQYLINLLNEYGIDFDDVWDIYSEDIPETGISFNSFINDVFTHIFKVAWEDAESVYTEEFWEVDMDRYEFFEDHVEIDANYSCSNMYLIDKESIDNSIYPERFIELLEERI